MKLIETREGWMATLVDRYRPTFKAAGFPLPEKIRCAIGFPSRGATSAKKRRIGECWSPTASADQTTEILVSPTMSKPVEVAEVIVHELVHAAVGNKHGHRGPFRTLATKLGLVGPMTATEASPELKAKLAKMCEAIGPLPHAALDVSKRKKQGIRQRKLECDSCDVILRASAKVIRQIGEFKCPGCRKGTVSSSEAIPDEEEG